MQHLAAQQTGGLNLRYWGLTQGQQNTYDSMVAKIIGNWKKDPNKSMTRLVVLAHECLTSSQNCK